ncbi:MULTISPECIES: hypothetical protein [Ramlibacter]|uniref:MSHA biogenesis protein MshK n=1 Tax=Ramlibacter aquaticus TaxID=2780094 RepID=A0ABR9SL16_9BURK|nr:MULTISPECIES: hypothetical protein [Ramlibacter]MBE7942727.1 hypothetical protein [Ramlibacter aquaticus]
MKHVPSRRAPLRPLAFALVALASAGAQAQADPTKPSAAWLAAQAKSPGQKEPEATESSGPANAQILLSGRARRFAMVDGHVVRPGESYNGAKLVAVGEEGAVWDRGGTRESSSMTPAVQKTTVAADKAKALPATKKHKESK